MLRKTGEKSKAIAKRKFVRSKNPLADVRSYRLAMGETQTEFWSRFMVTQSGGSRYEMDLRSIPNSVAMLVVGFADGTLSEEILATLAAKVRRSYD